MRKSFKPIVFLMLFLSTFSLFSQNSRIVDSLRTLITKAPDDSNKVNLYYTLSRQFDIFKSKDYFEINLAALNLSQKINFTSGINRHYSNVIRFLFQRGIYDLAIAYYHDYEQFLTENNMNDELQASYNMYGNLLSRQKKYSEANDYCVKSLLLSIANYVLSVFADELSGGMFSLSVCII
jgi:tetratricopeptide (TPR) repeat protein